MYLSRVGSVYMSCLHYWWCLQDILSSKPNEVILEPRLPVITSSNNWWFLCTMDVSLSALTIQKCDYAGGPLSLVNLTRLDHLDKMEKFQHLTENHTIPNCEYFYNFTKEIWMASYWGPSHLYYFKFYKKLNHCHVWILHILSN